MNEKTSNRRHATQIPFGLLNGRLYEPLQVTRGIQCGCLCPGCGAPLVSKHAPAGKVRPYFSHASGTSCENGLESAVHLAAKQLIKDQGRLYLPQHEVSVSKQGWFKFHKHSVVVHERGLQPLEDVRAEQALGNVRPDLIVKVEGQEILVEIAYTHFVDESKLAKLQHIGKGVVEIDVADLRQFDFDVLSQRLFGFSGYSKWLYHPGTATVEAELNARLQYDLRAEEEARKAAQIKAQRHQEALVRANTAKKIAETQRQLHLDDVTAKRAAEFAALSKQEKMTRALRFMGVEDSSPPNFLAQQVRAAGTILAPTILWQTAVFAALIHRKSQQTGHLLTVEQVTAWLPARFKVDRSRGKPEVAVWDFLSSLAKLHILEWRSREGFWVTVAGLSGAEALAADHASGQARQLVWQAVWPSFEKVEELAAIFGHIFTVPSLWNRIAQLPPSTREQGDPLDIMLRFTGYGITPGELRRFLLAAEFASI